MDLVEIGGRYLGQYAHQENFSQKGLRVLYLLELKIVISTANLPVLDLGIDWCDLLSLNGINGQDS
jgi:hypothetical protein